MKSLIIATGILLTILSVTFFGALFIDKRLADFDNTINKLIPDGENDPKKIYRCAMEIENEYQNIEKYLILFIHDDNIDKTEEYIEDIKSSALINEVNDAIIAKNRLSLHIRQLRRLSGFSTEAIF